MPDAPPGPTRGQHRLRGHQRRRASRSVVAEYLDSVAPRRTPPTNAFNLLVFFHELFHGPPSLSCPLGAFHVFVRPHTAARWTPPLGKNPSPPTMITGGAARRVRPQMMISEHHGNGALRRAKLTLPSCYDLKVPRRF